MSVLVVLSLLFYGVGIILAVDALTEEGWRAALRDSGPAFVLATVLLGVTYL